MLHMTHISSSQVHISYIIIAACQLYNRNYECNNQLTYTESVIISYRLIITPSLKIYTKFDLINCSLLGYKMGQIMIVNVT